MTGNMDFDLRVSLENNPLVIIASTAANRPTRSTRIKSPDPLWVKRGHGTKFPENSQTLKHYICPRVGADFQADIPNFKEGNDNDSDSHPSDLCIWSPEHYISEDDLLEFIRTAKEEHHLNEEQALGLIALKLFNLKAAKLELSRWCSNFTINFKRSMSLPAHMKTYIDCNQNGANCVKNVNPIKYGTVVSDDEVTFISESPSNDVNDKEVLINNPLVIMASTVDNRPTRKKYTEQSEVNTGEHMPPGVNSSKKRISMEPSGVKRGNQRTSPEILGLNRGQGDLFKSTAHRECWVNQHGKRIKGKKRKKPTLKTRCTGF